MNDRKRRDASTHETIYRVVEGAGKNGIVYEHPITEVTPTEVYVDRKPSNGRALGIYRTRQGTYVLDREALERQGHYRTRYGPAQTSFYLDLEDADGPVERPPEITEEEEADAPAPDLRPVPADALQAGVVKHFEQISAMLDRRYEREFPKRLLLEIALRLALVDFQVHGKDSPLVQQIDSLSIRLGLETTGAEPDLRPVPVERMRADVVGYLEKAMSALRLRYDEDFAERRFLEVALRQMFADLRSHEHESAVIQWLDVLMET
jgi:hypothetical protein